MSIIDEEWEKFLHTDYIDKENNNNEAEKKNMPEYPKCSGLTISTKVKVLYLNIRTLDIYRIFWLLGATISFSSTGICE